MDLPAQANTTPRPFPIVWGQLRAAANPVINGTSDPQATNEQYDPAPILVGSTYWVYVKGGSQIYAWSSTDGVTFTIQNSGNPVIAVGAGGTWDSTDALEPTVVYDQANATIHLYYKGYNGTVWQIGHATAPDSTPSAFTKDAGNPILTNAAVVTALGGQAITDLAFGSVIKIGATFYFYGYVNYNGTYSLFYTTGTTWNNPAGATLLLSAPATWQSILTSPAVFKYGSLYGMFYTLGGTQNSGNWPASFPRMLFAAFSTDGANWTFNSSTIVAPNGTGWEQLETFGCRLLLSSASPFAAPIADASGRWFLYYSGLSTAGVASTGLMYLTPS